MLKVSTCFNTVAALLSMVILLQYLQQVWCQRISVNWIQHQEKNWKEPSTSTISTDVSFNIDSNEETLNVNTKMDIKHI